MESVVVCEMQIAAERLPARLRSASGAEVGWWFSADDFIWGIFGTIGQKSPDAPVLRLETVERIGPFFGSRVFSGWLSS